LRDRPFDFVGGMSHFIPEYERSGVDAGVASGTLDGYKQKRSTSLTFVFDILDVSFIR
jgi:hypothetical protein